MELKDEFLSNALQLREELLKHEFELKDELLSRVSHELRSPLTAIYQFTTILLDGLAGEISEQQREYLEIALRNVRQLQAMIDDLLSAARARTGQLGVQSDLLFLAEPIEQALEALRPVAADKGIDLTESTQADQPPAFADRSLVRQILIHLIHNGIKFTPAGGAIRVSAGVLESDPTQLLVQVRDTGCGIEADQLERIFERLSQVPDPEQAGRRGLGLGLYIVRELAQRQGGRIWAESRPGEGSCFSLTLPAFSLPRLIEPVACSPKRLQDSLSLVRVEAVADDVDCSGAAFRAAVRSAREILRRALVPGLEVLLPEVDPSGVSGRFWVLGATEENAGQSAIERLREHLSRSTQLQRTGLIFATRNTPLEPLDLALDAPLEHRLQALAGKIQAVRGEVEAS